MRPAFTRRRMMSAAMLALATKPLSAQSPAHPNRPIKIVVPSPPGGSTDQLARLVAQWLQGAWGQSVVIDTSRAPVCAWARTLSPSRPPTATRC